MNAKQQIAEILENSGDEYISGSAIADSLGITRAAVWKCIKQMEEDGYEIESSKKGYRLGSSSDPLSASCQHHYSCSCSSMHCDRRMYG